MHNDNIKNNDGKTLKDVMIKSHMPVPTEW